MNEVVETIYQWHKGMKIQHNRLASTERRCASIWAVGITQGGLLPEEQELESIVKGGVTIQAAVFHSPALDLVARYRDEIEKLLEDTEMTGYSTMKRYLRLGFAFGRTKATVCRETPPSEEAQVDFGYAGLM